MEQQITFTFVRAMRRDAVLAALQPPPCNLLPEQAASLHPIRDAAIPEIDGTFLKVGKHLGSGIDKSAYCLLDEQGAEREDVVLKVAKHSNSCYDNNQCKNEIDMFAWLLETSHPYVKLFAGVVAIVNNIEVCEAGETERRTAYLCERVAVKRQIGGCQDGMETMKHVLSAYFGMYDLHDNNIGVATDGRCVVLDFGLFNGFGRVQEQWSEALAENPDATPEEILAELAPLYSGESDNADRLWCEQCETYASEEHCHCTECERERRGGEYCSACHTVTVETSRITEDTARVLCSTCLRDAREQRTPKHDYDEIVWTAHTSCECSECYNDRAYHAAIEQRKQNRS